MAHAFSDYLNPDSDLAHYGVKGMKWGVRKAEAKSAFNAGREKDFAEYKRRVASVDKKREFERQKARKAGQGRLQARRTALKKTSKDYDRIDAWDQKQYDKRMAKQNNTLAKIKAEKKAAVKAGRDYNRNELKTNIGKAALKNVLMGPAATYGYNAARGSGASRGEALVSGYLLGVLGGAGYRKVANRRK